MGACPGHRSAPCGARPGGQEHRCRGHLRRRFACWRVPAPAPACPGPKGWETVAPGRQKGLGGSAEDEARGFHLAYSAAHPARRRSIAVWYSICPSSVAAGGEEDGQGSTHRDFRSRAVERRRAIVVVGTGPPSRPAERGLGSDCGQVWQPCHHDCGFGRSPRPRALRKRFRHRGLRTARPLPDRLPRDNLQPMLEQPRPTRTRNEAWHLGACLLAVSLGACVSAGPFVPDTTQRVPPPGAREGADPSDVFLREIGRASCRERV